MTYALPQTPFLPPSLATTRHIKVNWDHVRVLPDGEAISTAGTHLGHNLPDSKGNRVRGSMLILALH